MRGSQVLEGPDDRDEGDGDGKDHEVDHRADADEIEEFVAARTIDQRIGLIADRVRKLALAANITATTKGRGSMPRVWASVMARGVTITATALLVTTSVRAEERI